MTYRLSHLCLASALIVGLAGCAPVDGASPIVPFSGATGPQYEPGDPCKGVVPQLCAYDGPAPGMS